MVRHPQSLSLMPSKQQRLCGASGWLWPSSSDDSSSTNDNLFAKANFVIDSLPDRELIKCKHHADWTKCRGDVEYSQCRQCRVRTPGVLNYSFQVLIRDKEERNQLYLNVDDRGGAHLFLG